MNATILEQAGSRLIAARSKNFPEVNRAAFASIESHLNEFYRSMTELQLLLPIPKE